MKLNLSTYEIDYLQKCDDKEIYFKNGIYIFEDKHINFNYYIYYMEIPNHSLRDLIETNWRKKYGIPQLCSYLEGR